MNKSVETLRQFRSYLLNIINEFSTDQLNKIPEGFNNNIVWNLAHMVVAQQGICYKRSGLNMIITEDFYEAYKPGSKPLKSVDSEEIATIKELMISSLHQLEADLNNKLFVSYTGVVTRYGVELKGIEDAVDFLLVHDGLHAGQIMAISKLV